MGVSTLLVWLASLVPFFVPATAIAQTPSRPVKLGIDVLLDSRIDVVAGKRVGLITNASAVDGRLVPTLDRLRADGRVNLVQLYAPEHGLGGAMANGKSDRKGMDSRTGLPIEGLFGSQSAPSPKSLARIDVLLFDVQDIGSRTYTYATTLGRSMIANVSRRALRMASGEMMA